MQYWIATILTGLGSGWVGAALHEAYYQRIEHNKVYDHDPVE